MSDTFNYRYVKNNIYRYMIVIINGVETEINDSLFSYGEMIKKRDEINYFSMDFSSINQLKGDKNILKICFKETKKELLEQHG